MRLGAFVPGESVYLTRNGRGRFVVMDIEDYARDRAEKSF